MGYSFQLTARVLLYASSHRQDYTYHSLCYTSHGALAGTRNSSVGPPHEGSIRRPIAPWANALTTLLLLEQLVEKFPIRSVGRVLEYSNWGSVVRIPLVEIVLSVTLGAQLRTECVLKTRIQSGQLKNPLSL